MSEEVQVRLEIVKALVGRPAQQGVLIPVREGYGPDAAFEAEVDRLAGVVLRPSRPWHATAESAPTSR